MTTENILTLFEGLTKDEALQFRSAIIPALQKLRAEIVEKRQKKSISKAETCRGNKDYEMYSDNKQRQAV